IAALAVWRGRAGVEAPAGVADLDAEAIRCEREVEDHRLALVRSTVADGVAHELGCQQLDRRQPVGVECSGEVLLHHAARELGGAQAAWEVDALGPHGARPPRAAREEARRLARPGRGVLERFTGFHCENSRKGWS